MMIALTRLIVEQVLLQTFKIKKILYKVIFFLILTLTSVKVFAAEDYLRYYSENKKDIFNSIEKPFISNNYVYSISIVENLDEIVVIDRLKSKSELMAIGNITKNYPKYNIEWPPSYSQKLINEMWKHYLKNNPKKIQIDSKQFINIDNGLISEDESNKYFFSVIVFQKSYLDSIFNIDINNVFISLKK